MTAAEAPVPGSTVTGRVVAVHRGQADVEVPGIKHWILCSTRGSLREIRGSARRSAVNTLTIGDRVTLTLLDETQGVIEKVAPRRSQISRPDVHSTHLEQVLCANIDQAVIMVSARSPRFKAQVVDRLVVICLWGGVQPLIVLSKCDLVTEEEIASIATLYEGLNIPFVRLSAPNGEGVDAIRELCRGKLTAFIGQSGVGKSTLLNILCGRELVPTTEVNRKTGKGRHTTSWSEIYPLPDGEVIDLPGNQSFGLWQVPHEVLAQFLPDIRQWGQECHFQPCSHMHEPHCRVARAVEEGELPLRRWENYSRIYDSLKD